MGGIIKSFKFDGIESPDSLLKETAARIYFYFSEEFQRSIGTTIESDIEPDGVFRIVSVVPPPPRKYPDFKGQPLDDVIDMILTGNFPIK